MGDLRLVRGRARLSDNFAAKALSVAIARKADSETALRSLGLSPEKSLVEELLGMMELAQTLDTLNPVSISPSTYGMAIEILDDLIASATRFHHQLDALIRLKGEADAEARGG